MFWSPFKDKLDSGPTEFGSGLTWALWTTGKSSWDGKLGSVSEGIFGSAGDFRTDTFSLLDSEPETESEPELDPSVEEESSFLVSSWVREDVCWHSAGSRVSAEDSGYTGAGVTVKMHSSKKVLLSTYFRENKYSPVYISQVQITPGITFFLGNNYSSRKKSTPLHGHNFLHIIFPTGLKGFLSTSILPLGRQFTQSLFFQMGSLWLASLWLG